MIHGSGFIHALAVTLRCLVRVFFPTIFCCNMGKRKSVCCNKNVQKIKASPEGCPETLQTDE